jgi:Tfp pilus assembly protein PilF
MEERRAQRTRVATAYYAAGLGYLGLQNRAKAEEDFTKTLEASPDHAGAKSALENLD